MTSPSRPSVWIDEAVASMRSSQRRRNLLEEGRPLALQQLRFEKALLEAGVGRHYLAWLTGQKRLHETTSIRAVKAFAEDPSRWCLVLAGSRGVGKSLAASWLLARVLQQRGVSAVTRRHVFSSLQVMRARRDDKLLQLMFDVELLVLDDLGVEIPDQAGLFMWCLFEVFNHRWANRKRTVVTTNVPPLHLEARYGQRVTDRLRDGGRFVVAKGQSLRLR